jgi:CubicO group peptidase (beta-lactamase class C family)
MSRLFIVLCTLTSLFASPLSANADTLDDFINVQLAQHHVPGLSLAIIEGGKIVRAQGYGVVDKVSKAPVTPSTLFQAGSISKSVSALGALSLVEKGAFALDEDVNAKLTTWKVPENEFTKQKRVTLRAVLSHSAGLTVHGFGGYAVDAPLPTLVQILDGEKPANSPAIRVDILPGSQWRYSGGGYTVMQQMMIDATGAAFPQIMQKTVLDPLGMTSSSYEQPLPSDKAQTAATGYSDDGKAVPGRWHVYPEMAAAGLWTTPSDLCRFVIGVQKARSGAKNSVISQAMTKQMLTIQKNNDGLGVFLDGKGRDLRFSHNGRDEGFDAFMVGYAEKGRGAVIMMNANNDSPMASRILGEIAQEYKWRDYPIPPVYKPIPDKEPKVTERLKAFYQQAADGKFDKDLFTPQFAETIENWLKNGEKDFLHNLGEIQSFILVERTDKDGKRLYRYRISFKDSVLLTQFLFDKDDKITDLQSSID